MHKIIINYVSFKYCFQSCWVYYSAFSFHERDITTIDRPKENQKNLGGGEIAVSPDISTTIVIV